ncbi:MAG: hypothetical protein IPK84_05240 [Candidatus Moraniibacteriota bacterium]|nr:MAG: hypothetical protein IPK84_05240 [Candidatus Moranbacteria bacterium]
MRIRLAVLFNIALAWTIFVSSVAAQAISPTPSETEGTNTAQYTNCRAVIGGFTDHCVGEISPEIGGQIVRYGSLEEVLANGIIPPTDRALEGCTPREMFFFSNWTGWNGTNGTARVFVRDTAEHTLIIPAAPQEGAGYWGMSFQCPDSEDLVFAAFNADWWSSPLDVETGVSAWHMNPGDETSLYPGLASYGNPTHPQVSIMDDGSLRFAFNSDVMSALVLKGSERYGTRSFEIKDCALNSGSTGWEPSATVRALLTVDDRGYIYVDFPLQNVPRQEWIQFSCLAAGSQTTLQDGSFLWLNIEGFDFPDSRIHVDKENGLFSVD